MLTALKEETYKFCHEKIALLGLLVLLVTTLYSTLTKTINKSTLIFAFGAIEWIPVIIIAVGAAFFEMEYDNKTIVMLLYKNSSKLKIYLAKFLVVFCYSIALALGAILLTFLLSLLTVPGQYHWLAYYQGHTILTDLLLNLFGAVIYCFFIVGLSVMLIMLVKANTVVICIGLVLAYFGASFSTALMHTFPTAVEILKWNPLNMIFISQQLTRGSFALKSNLTNFQLIIATVVYGIIFGLLGYYLFKRRRV